MASILSLFPLLILHILLLVPTKTYSQRGPLLTCCAGDTNYTVPSTFSSNLDLLLSNLTSSPRDAGYFSNTTVGASSSAPAYGLAQCLPEVCASNTACLNRSASFAATLCPLRKSAAIRLDLCILRYSNQRFFGQLEDEDTWQVSQLEGEETWQVVNPNNGSDPAVFYRQMRVRMDESASQAAATESKLGVGITNSTQYGHIHTMAQCTRDLSETDCSTRLSMAVGFLPVCCYGRIGGQASKVSCAVRFEIYPFFSLSLVPPLSPGSSSSPDSGNGTNTTSCGKQIVKE